MAQAALIIGIASSIYGAVKQSDAERSQAAAATRLAAYQSGVYNQNAATEEQAARDAVARGDENAGRLETESRGLVGKQSAAYASQGVVVGQGSAADVSQDTYNSTRVDTTTVRNNAWQESMGLTSQAQQFRRQAQFTLAEGASQSDAFMQASQTSLVTGGLNAANQYLSYYGSSGSNSRAYQRPEAPRLKGVQFSR